MCPGIALRLQLSLMIIDLPEDRPQLELELADGAVALLSPLAAGDRLFLVEGLAELSIESRYARFGQGVGSLTEAEFDYLTNIDLHNHVAWGGAIDGEGAGVGRYIRLDDRESAEIAVTVLDRYQRRGLGNLLFRALTAIARADGISEFRFEFVPENVPVRRMVGGLDIDLDSSGSALIGRVSLDEIPLHEHEEQFVSVMAEARSRLEADS
jgi:GNAT superfamily N-acetyltransferase